MKFNLIILISFLCSILNGCANSDKQNPKDVTTLVEHLYGGTGGISVDQHGNIFSSDFGPFLGTIPNFNAPTRVFKITPEGQVSIYADSLAGSSGSDFDMETGTLYQSNIRGGYISKINNDGVVDSIATDSIIGPVGIYYNPDEIVVCNCGNNTLRKIDKESNSTLFAQSDLFKCPNGITKDQSNNYYVSNFFDGWVLKILPSGEVSRFVEIPGNNNGHLIFKNNSLYVVARSAHQVYKVSMNSELTLLAGSGDRGRKNDSLLTSSFNFPNDLDFSPDGKYLYLNELSDTLSDHRVLSPTSIRRLKIK